MSAPRRAGRRRGNSGTREAILAAARRRFAELGYDRTTMRGLALEAGVDAALVSHFYGSKRRLFTIAVDLPFEPTEVLRHLLAGPRDTVGDRLARFLLHILETDEDRQRITGLIRAAVADEGVARRVRDTVTRELLLPLAEGMSVPDAPLRAALVWSQIVGLVTVGHTVVSELLAGRSPEILIGAIGPVFQHCLTAPLQRSGPYG